MCYYWSEKEIAWATKHCNGACKIFWHSQMLLTMSGGHKPPWMVRQLYLTRPNCFLTSACGWQSAACVNRRLVWSRQRLFKYPFQFYVNQVLKWDPAMSSRLTRGWSMTRFAHNTQCKAAEVNCTIARCFPQLMLRLELIKMWFAVMVVMSGARSADCTMIHSIT